MPKVDRCAALKKESQSARKRVNAQQSKVAKDTVATERADAQKEWDDKLATERAAHRDKVAPPQSKFERAMKEGAAAKKGFVAAALESSEDESPHYEEPKRNGSPPPGDSTPPRPVDPKKAKEERKRLQTNRLADEMRLMADEQMAARRERVKRRFLQMLLVGFVLDMGQQVSPGGSPREQPGGKGEKKRKGSKEKLNLEGSSWSIKSTREWVSKMTGPALMVGFTCLIAFLVIAGAEFDPHFVEAEVSHYEVLGVGAEADMLEIRKAYKGLALSWHPDKNPDCEACATRFAKIGQAYEVLTNPERKAAYDQRRAPDGSSESVASVELTADDFETRVLRSNDLWYVQVYESRQDSSRSFHALWEDVAQKSQDVARFGRLDVSKDRRVVRLLPQRVAIFPVVFRYARGQAPELYQPDLHRMHEDNGAMSQWSRFVSDKSPKVETLDNEAAVLEWWHSAAGRPRVLLAHPAAAGGRGLGKDFLPVQRVALQWAEFFDVRVCDQRSAVAVLGELEKSGALPAEVKDEDKPPLGRQPWVLAARTSANVSTGNILARRAKDTLHAAAALQALVTDGIAERAPQVTLRNHHQLCGLQHGMRTYCLFLVDQPSAAKVDAALAELQGSRKAFAQELLELQESDEEATEEPFHVQPVQVVTSNSRLPWNPTAVPAAFHTAWATAGYAPAFLLELETRRVAPVRTASLAELYQQVAYDDLRFTELPEAMSLIRAMPDGEVPLSREFTHLLATVPGAICAFLVLAGAYAVGPELPLQVLAAAAASLAALAVLAWPLASRRFVALFWCLGAEAHVICGA